jgi:ABC-type uncharacterized transport system permease subunit
MTAEALTTILIAMLGGAIRVSTPFIFVALGETLTEKAGRINLGLEGNLVLGAMVAYAISFHTGSPWLGVLAAGFSGVFLGLMHGSICSLKKVNDIAVGIAMMSFGIGVAFFFGKPYIQPSAPRLESLPLGGWASNPALQQALEINPLFIVGILIAIVMWWALANTRVGLVVRMTGDSEPAARAMGINPIKVRILATAAGGFLAGIGGAFLSLSYPGSWNEGLSSGPGTDGRGPGDLRPLEPASLHSGRAALRRRRCAGARASVRRHQPGLLLLQCGALHPDTLHHGCRNRKQLGPRGAG